MIAAQFHCLEHRGLSSLCKQTHQARRHTDRRLRAVERLHRRATMDKCHIHIISVE